MEERRWIRWIQLLDQDEPGFWESLGYHNYGDPWQSNGSGATEDGGSDDRLEPGPGRAWLDLRGLAWLQLPLAEGP